jgi:hypothetical protein
LSRKNSPSNSGNAAGVRFAVGWHVAIGLLLMWLDPLASLSDQQAGQIIGLRETYPLLPHHPFLP